MEIETDMHVLVSRILSPVQQGQNVGFFLDYDGTLRDFVDEPEQAIPDAALIDLLRELASHPRIFVALISGRKANFLEAHLSGLGVTLVCEHGYMWLERGRGQWMLLDHEVETEWKEDIREILTQAVRRLPDTHIEEKRSALVWHYRKADPLLGALRAEMLVAALNLRSASGSVTVHHGNKIVEVSSRQVSKGNAVNFLVQRWRCAFAFVAGDDQTDESMMGLRPRNVDFHAVKVGKGATDANYRTDITGLRALLQEVCQSMSFMSPTESLKTQR